ncbi:hypothetical protein ABE091_01795, partial [Bacillus pumilus]
PKRSEFAIREHRRAGLTPNARVCLHALTVNVVFTVFFYCKTCKTPQKADLLSILSFISLPF